MLRTAWLQLLLGLTLAAVAPAAAQGRDEGVELLENAPNPVTTTTTIGFILREEVCAAGHVPTVSLEIYNVLVQVVAVPVLVADPPTPVSRLRLPCGEHRAVWDGRLRDGRPAQTGVYYYQLVVDGQRFTRKLIVQRSPSGAT